MDDGDATEFYFACFVLAISICLTLLSLYQYITIKFDNRLQYSKLTLKPYKFIFIGMCFQTIEQVLLCLFIN